MGGNAQPVPNAARSNLVAGDRRVATGIQRMPGCDEGTVTRETCNKICFQKPDVSGSTEPSVPSPTKSIVSERRETNSSLSIVGLEIL